MAIVPGLDLCMCTRFTPVSYCTGIRQNRAAVILSAAECCKEPHAVFEFINGDRKHLIVNLNLFEEITTIIILISITIIIVIRLSLSFIF